MKQPPYSRQIQRPTSVTWFQRMTSHGGLKSEVRFKPLKFLIRLLKVIPGVVGIGGVTEGRWLPLFFEDRELRKHQNKLKIPQRRYVGSRKSEGELEEKWTELWKQRSVSCVSLPRGFQRDVGRVTLCRDIPAGLCYPTQSATHTRGAAPPTGLSDPWHTHDHSPL